MPEALECAGAVNFGCLIQIFTDALQIAEIDYHCPAEPLPYLCENNGSQCRFAAAQKVDCTKSQPVQYLIDKTGIRRGKKIFPEITDDKCTEYRRAEKDRAVEI